MNPSENMMSDQLIRIIKKYPNRRLYDTEVSRYITLNDVRDLVLERKNFKVVDKQSGEDITRSILLQVISEEEEGGNPMFSTEVLLQFIRFYGDTMQNSVTRYLELSMHFFDEQQSQFKDRLQRILGSTTPLQALREISQQQMPLWKTVRKEFINSLNPANSSRKKTGKND